jgi:hygromycin-B 4-O-kinase
MRAVLPSLFAALDAMRAVDLSRVSGYGGWRADGRTQAPTWRARLLGVGTDPGTRGAKSTREMLAGIPIGLSSFEAGYARMRDLVGFCPEERHLIHDDLINYNVLVVGDRISAVLDWGSSTYGDFLYDLAKLVFYQPWYPAWLAIDFAAEARAHYERIGVAVPHFDERVLCYALRIGIGDMGYNAYRKRPQRIADNAARVVQLLRAP